jgi:hypothetical protein
MQTRKFIASGLLALAALVLGGCATVPNTEAMRAEVAAYQLPKAPDPGGAMVYVVRPSGLGALIRFNVFLNDQQPQSEMGYTRGAQYIYFSVPPGSHKLYSKAENWADLPFTVKAGDVVFVQQDVAMGLIMARNTLSVLDDYQGKYHVKKLERGTILKGQ